MFDATEDVRNVRRHAAMKVLCSGVGETGVGWAPKIAFNLLQSGVDAQALTPAWNMGGLIHANCVKLALGRVARTTGRAPADLVALYASLCAFAPSSDAAGRQRLSRFALSTQRAFAPIPLKTFTVEVITSLYDASVNARTDDVLSAASDKPAGESLLVEGVAIHGEPRGYEASVMSDRSLAGVVAMLAATDVVGHTSDVLVGDGGGPMTTEMAAQTTPALSFKEELMRLEDDEHHWERHDSTSSRELESEKEHSRGRSSNRGHAAKRGRVFRGRKRERQKKATD